MKSKAILVVLGNRKLLCPLSRVFEIVERIPSSNDLSKP